MAAHSETEINLKTLQRVDPNIIEIIDNASQVAIYKYERKQEKWEGTDIEGTLFLYRSSQYPYHGFIIVNRMNTTNFIESITSDMQFQLQEPYLLYKNHSGDIIGSWFYEYKDLRRISKKIQTIVLKQTTPSRRQRCASESETPRKESSAQDIMALLSHAHEEYMKTTSTSQSSENNHKDINKLSAHPAKKSFEKSVDPQGKKLRDFPIRSSSQDMYPASPRRRFLSTGSFDPDRLKSMSALGMEPFGKIQNTKVQEVSEDKRELISKSIHSIISPKDFNISLLHGEKVAPTRLSPLFSHNEISSPISDVEVLEDSFEEQPFPECLKLQNKLHPSSDESDWKNGCDVHFTCIKEVLKSHIQENPNIMLKVHEAYVSSLRSLFTKN